ncbi:hypothetical protein HNQ38_002017 [Desulfovibrio intestinalis]|uniref:Uncharacterized protein n=1 Tax=Desulfovibrio intestinalis TaxID=58621 RepID=A0A7W8C1J0_9BACT|nr:hypothetical protein [Desulfovibrio intestinalis]
MQTQMNLIPILNPSEAPSGHYAVLKSSVVPLDCNENICRHCDWRPECQKNNHPVMCMPYEVLTPDGRTLRRMDGCSVVFKRK